MGECRKGWEWSVQPVIVMWNRVYTDSECI